MAVQTPVTITRAGYDVTANAVTADAGGTEKWAGTGQELLAVINGSGGSITVTLVGGVGYAVDSQTPTNRTVAVAAGHTALIGPFPESIYNDSSGNVNISWSATTSVKLLVFVP